MMALLLFYGVTVAQTRTITGRVVDAQGQPVPNASVVVKGSSSGTTTNAEGNYSITVPSGTTALTVSSVGFSPIDVRLGSSNTYQTTLASEFSEVESVIVTGYTRERKGRFAGAATVISAKAVENVPVGAFDQALQGRAPGVLVNSGTGQPGSSANVVIRGIQSISGAGVQPLYVLDGVPIPASDMQAINPNDFESITVLKDAGAAAMYGARGGTGVIVITTKKGRAGSTTFTARSQVGFTQAPNATNFDMMNTAEILEYEERLGLAGLGSSGPGWAYSRNNPNYANQTPATQARYDFLLDSFRNINSTYSDMLFRQGVSTTQEINVSGGTDRTRFFLSAGFFDQKGTDLNSRLRRYTTRFNIDHTVNKLTVRFNSMVGYAITNYNEGDWLGNSARNPFQMAWRAKPYENPYRADGSIIFGANTALNPRQIGNVLEGIQNSIWTDNQIKLNTGLFLAYKILPSLTLANQFGIDVGSERGQRAISPNSYIGTLQTFQSGFNAESYRIRANLVNTTSLVFNKQIGTDHEVEVGGYFEVVRNWQRGLGFFMFNLDPRLEYTGQGAGALPTAGSPTYPQNANSAKSGFGIRSYFANARYTFNGKYTITGNVRRDGTSRILNESNREINTWSAGAIWDAFQEDFMDNQNILSDLKVRVSYGAVPNIGSIPTGSYTISGSLYGITNYLGPQLPVFGTSTAFPGSTITGLVPTTPGNANLDIEYIQKLNVGVDFGVWNNRARFSVDAYQNKTVNLFVDQPLSATTGFGGTTTPINAGTMTNKGVEFAVNVDVVKSKLVDVRLGINHSINKNEIVDLGLVNEYPVGTYIIKEGLPFGTHYTFHYLGADVQTGAPTYRTKDGGTTNDIGQAGLFHDFGTYLPKHVGGFTADVRVGRFSISALFSYQFDVTRYNNIENWVTRGTPGYHNAVNASRRLLTEQWQKPGDVKWYQAPQFDRGFTSSDVSDAKFLRFRNLNVSYEIPALTFKGTSVIKASRVYIQAQNLFIWSPWRGPDPEDNNNISLNEFPNPRMVVAGVDINF